MARGEEEEKGGKEEAMGERKGGGGRRREIRVSLFASVRIGKLGLVLARTKRVRRLVTLFAIDRVCHVIVNRSLQKKILGNKIKIKKYLEVI